MYAPQFSFAVGPSLLGMSSQASAQSAVLFAGHYITAIEWYKAMATIDTIQTNFVTIKAMLHGGEKYYFCRLASFSCLLTTYNGSWLAAVSKNCSVAALTFMLWFVVTDYTFLPRCCMVADAWTCLTENAVSEQAHLAH